jgi:hypothetical protein
MYRYISRGPLNLLSIEGPSKSSKDAATHVRNLQEIHEQVHKNLKATYDKYKAHADKKRCPSGFQHWRIGVGLFEQGSLSKRWLQQAHSS